MGPIMCIGIKRLHCNLLFSGKVHLLSNSRSHAEICTTIGKLLLLWQKLYRLADSSKPMSVFVLL